MLMIRWLIPVIGLLFSSFAYSQASTLTKEAGQDAVILMSGQTSDILTPPAPNSAGMSLMRFTDFTVRRPLSIINVTDNARTAAKLIVIETTQLSLLSSIEIVGEKADVLLINKSNFLATSCTACSLKNIARASIAAGNVAYNNGWPGQITLTSWSSITVNSLNAAGVGAVELIAPRVVLNGVINTQLRAAYGSDGSYLVNDSGPLVVGYGSFDVYAGFNYQYNTLDLKAVSGRADYGVELGGTLTTQAAKILATHPIIVQSTGVIDTTSDIASSVSYKGSLVLLDESIKIATLIPNKAIYLNGKLFSDKSIQVASTGELINNGIISANSLDGNAQDRFTNRGQLNVKNIKFAAGSLENNALINGRNVSLAAEGALLNRFGGKISGASVELVSRTGSIQNGSQYPFKPANETFNLLRADTETDIGLSTFSINGVPFQGATKVANLSAQIIGDTVTLSAAQNVQNINPYFEYTLTPDAWRSGVYFNYQKADQVQLVADTKLNIIAGSYVVNSSAIMGVNNPAGSFYIEAPNVANERYTTEAIIQRFERDARTTNASTTTTGFESLLVVFSPPGIIYSFAPVGFKFTVANGGFINNTSYFEVLNNADFVAMNGAQVVRGKVTSIGLALQDKLIGSSTVMLKSEKGCDKPFDPGPVNPYGGYAQSESIGRAYLYYHQSCGSWGSSSNVDLTGQTTEQMRGTLFSVKGNVNGDSTDVDGRNHHVIEDGDKDLLAAEIAKNTWEDKNFRVETGTNSYGNYQIDYKLRSTSQLSSDGKSILTSITAIHMKDVAGTIISYGGRTPSEALSIKAQEKTIIQSVEAFLVAQYLAAKTALMNLLAAFDNWLKQE